MKIINIQAAKTHLSRIVDEAADGVEIALAKAGKPMVRLVPFKATPKPRTPGLFAGQGGETPDAWKSAEKDFEAAMDGPLFHGATEESPHTPAKP